MAVTRGYAGVIRRGFAVLALAVDSAAGSDLASLARKGLT
jgi:hypothetical protein